MQRLIMFLTVVMMAILVAPASSWADKGGNPNRSPVPACTKAHGSGVAAHNPHCQVPATSNTLVVSGVDTSQISRLYIYVCVNDDLTNCGFLTLTNPTSCTPEQIMFQEPGCDGRLGYNLQSATWYANQVVVVSSIFDLADATAPYHLTVTGVQAVLISGATVTLSYSFA